MLIHQDNAIELFSYSFSNFEKTQFACKYYSSKCHCYKHYFGSTDGRWKFFTAFMSLPRTIKQPLPSEIFFADVSQLPSYKVLKSSSRLAGSKHVFVTETQLPKSESCYAEKDDDVSKPVPWNTVSLFNSSFLMNWGSPTPMICLHSLDPLTWFNSLTWQKTNRGGKNPPTSFFIFNHLQ